MIISHEQTWQEVDVLIVYFTDTATENEIQSPTKQGCALLKMDLLINLKHKIPPGDKL